MTESLVSTKYQVVIPKTVRRKLNVKPGQKLTVNAAGGQIILTPSKSKLNWPEDYIKRLRGLWKDDRDVGKYLEKERNSWE